MTALLVFLAVFSGSVSDVLNAAGMKRQGEITNWSARGLLSVGWDLLHNVYILLSIPVTAFSFFALLALFSATELSFAVPVSAISVVLDGIFAKFFLRERVTWHRWAGIVFVAVGIALLTM